jgi:polyhydroxybutyrate depolymerase
MTRTWIGLVLTVVALATGVSGEAKIKRETFGWGGRTRAYQIYVPDTVKPGTEAPLLVALHGSGRDGASIVNPWKGLAEKEGVILVGPDSLDKAFWNFKDDGPDFLHDLVEVVRAQHHVDGRRMYLFGHSAGAIQALEIGLLESEYFAAVAVHAGAIPKQELQFIGMADRKIPMAIWVGNDDPLFPPAAVQLTRDALDAGGIPIQLRVIPNHTHNYYQRSDEVNREAWAFVKGHKLENDPKFKQYAAQ